MFVLLQRIHIWFDNKQIFINVYLFNLILPLFNEFKPKCIVEIGCFKGDNTKNILDYPHHPIKKLYEDGMKVSINTDNRTVSNITLTEEYNSLLSSFMKTIDTPHFLYDTSGKTREDTANAVFEEIIKMLK